MTFDTASMTHEPLLVISPVTATGEWEGRRVSGAVTFEVLADRGALRGERGPAWSFPYHSLSDATWERETLSLHKSPEVLELRGPRELSRAWALVVERACALPEVARGLRTLGSARGGSAPLQSQFFGPLVAARRRLQEPEALERRVTLFDAPALSHRLTTTLAAFAAERHAIDLPRRRGLEARLDEASEPLHRALSALHEKSGVMHAAASGTRFLVWRDWTRLLRGVFLEADRAWSEIVPLLKVP